MKIKICGLTSPIEADYLNKNKVDFAGTVLFYPKSKRNINMFMAKQILDALDSSIKKVAVVVSPTVDQAIDICEAGYDIIQIHGTLEDDVYDVINIDIWKAFNVKDIDLYDTYKDKDKIKGFVFDSAEPGSGKAYDHRIISKIDRVPGKLFVLAGGLGPKNVKDAIDVVKPDVVDVSSSVEFVDKPGKEPAKIDEFVAAVESAI